MIGMKVSHSVRMNKWELLNKPVIVLLLIIATG